MLALLDPKEEPLPLAEADSLADALEDLLLLLLLLSEEELLPEPDSMLERDALTDAEEDLLLD